MAFTNVQNDTTRSTILLNVDQISTVQQVGSNAVQIKMTNGDIIDTRITYEQMVQRIQKAIEESTED